METKQVHKFSKPGDRKAGQSAKTDLLRQIQIMEGNYACFATAGSAGCSQGNCPWRRECLNIAH